MPSNGQPRRGEAQWRGRRALCSALGVVAALFLASNTVAQTPGPNRNVVSGVVHPLAPADAGEYDRAVIRTDLLRQRQNEPVMVPSSTQPEHLLAAANDYRTIDIAGDLGTGERNDSVFSWAVARVVDAFHWLLGIEREAPAPPRANADAWMGVYRSCNRGATWYGSLLPGSPTDDSPASLSSPLRGLETASDPVMAAAPGGRAYLGGLAFTREVLGTSAIFVARYTDRNDREGGPCFAYDFTRVVETGSISDTGRFADKPTIAADVTRVKGGNSWRYVYMAYTIFTGLETDANFRGRVRFVRSSDDGETWSRPVTVSGNYIHNQGAALAIDPSNGDLYLVWRDFVDHQILMASSHDFGAKWSDPEPIHEGSIYPFDQVTGEYQFRSNGFPTIAIDGSHQIFVAWQELANLNGEPDPTGLPQIVLTKSLSIEPGGVTWSPRKAVDPGLRPQVMPALSAHAGQVMLLYAERADESQDQTLVGIDVRLDMQIVEINPATGTPFEDRPPVQVSEYDHQASEDDPPPLALLPSGHAAYHRPNLPMFRGGTVPFIGDYQWLVAAQPFVHAEGGGWKWASDPGDVLNPSFHAIWTDNRNVHFPDFPPPPEGPSWEFYAPPGDCVNAGSKDQDVYTSEIGTGLVPGSPSRFTGLVAGSPSLFKPLRRPGNEEPGDPPSGEPIQRSFVVYVQNRTDEPKSVLLDLVPRDSSTTASFDQFAPVPSLPVDTDSSMVIFPHSTLTRSVFVDSTVWNASVDVEIRDFGTNEVVARVVLNESPSLFALTNTQISDSETHTPRISNPRISNPRISNPRISNPRISNWTVSNPRISNPRISNPRISNTSLSEGWETRDVTYSMINTGNTTTVYDLLTYLPEEYVNEGSPYEFQLIVYRTTSSPGTDVDNGSCAPVEVLYDEFISSVETPRISNPRISNPRISNGNLFNPRISNPRISNASFYLEPAEGPVGADTGGDATQSALGPASSTFSLERLDTRTSSLDIVNSAASTLAADSGDAGSALPVPQVHWTLRIYQTRELADGEPTLDELAPTDPAQEPQVSATIVSQSTNVIDGVPEENPPFVLVGPEPPTPETLVDGELQPIPDVSTSPMGLTFSQQPTSTQVGQTITPPVEVRLVDASGATVPVSGNEVTLTLPANPGALSGTLTRLSDSGFATFDDLVISATGVGYTLQATSTGLTSATSTSFDVTVDTPVVPPITTRVSIDTTGAEGYGPDEGCSGGRSITPDGRYVAFACTFTELVPDDHNGARDVFVRDLQTETTTRVSVNSAGVEGDGDSTFASLSDDGRFVAFQSVATNLDNSDDNCEGNCDDNWVSDIFVHDRDTFETKRVSVGFDRVNDKEANGASTLPVISGDGSTVAFWSDATNLVPNDTNGEPDVFVVDRATLAVSRVSVKTGGEQANAVEGLALPAAPALSRNGRIVAFQSTRADLADQGKVGWRDIYVHDRDTLATTRVSVASDGTAGTIPKGCGPWDGPEGKFACADFASSNPSLSADGRFVAFDSIYNNLVPGDTNFDGNFLGRDVFVHDRQTGQTTRVSVSTQGVQDNTLSETGAPCGTGPHAPALSPEGRFVTFSSCGSSLVADDTNGISDAFLHDRFLDTTVRVSVSTGGAQVTTDSGAFGTRFTAPSNGAQRVAMGSDVETMVVGDTNRYLTAGELGTDIFVSQPVPAPAPPAERYLAFTVQPGDTPERETILPAIEVEIQDAYGNTDLTATNLVTLSVASGPGALLGTITVSAVNGVALFPDLSLTEEGAHTLRANAVGFAGTVSASFVVLPPIAVQLGFVVQPVDAEATAPITPAVAVAIQDDLEGTVTTRTDVITLSLTDPADGLLYGTTSVAAVDGVAVFDDLSVDVAAAAYSLEATAAGLASATSALFDVGVSSTPLTFTVTNTNDAGRGSLRQAMLAANGNDGHGDLIEFAMPGVGPHVISLTSALPSITDPVTIDATTQPGYLDAPLVELDGSLSSGTTGLVIFSGNSVVRGLSITGFSTSGIILLTAGGSTIENNFLGTDPEGASGKGNTYGIEGRSSSNNRILNNVISGNSWWGIFLTGGEDNLIDGNLIGTTPDGLGALPNERSGITIYPQTTPGYPMQPATRLVIRQNLISGNVRYGINLVRSSGTDPYGAEGTQIMGNTIGLNSAGAALGNGYGGLIANSTTGTRIGSPAAADGNVVSGNGGTGILIDGSGAVPAVIQGNRVGTDPSGTEARPNEFGIWVRNSAGNLIGGAAEGEGNLVSGNSTGVRIWGPATTGTVFQGNLVGTNVDGSAPLGNTNDGVAVGDAAAATLIGGTADGAGNVISGNNNGVVIGGADAVIQGNFIGTDSTGTAPIGNTSAGVEVAGGATNARIGGTVVGARNVISGGNRGISIMGVLATGTIVEGNYIGVDRTGLVELGNSYVGVQLYQTSNHRIGPAAAADDDEGRNVISGNERGLLLYDVSDISVENNYIGTNSTGTAVIDNNLGVVIYTSVSGSALNNTVRDNLISGNSEAVWLVGSVSNNIIEGNRIGVGELGGVLSNTRGVRVNGGTNTTLRYNEIANTGEWAVYLCCGAENTTIDSNTVRSNGEGILLANTTGSGNRISSNFVSGNGGLGIDLNDDGVTDNDGLEDTDTGPNNLQNFPVVELVVSDAVAGTTAVSTSLDSTPSTTFGIELFHSSSCDPSGYGEGETPILTTSLTTDESGHASGTTTFVGVIPSGSYVTATATDPNGNTSEFSACWQVLEPVSIFNTFDAGGTFDPVLSSSAAGGALLPEPLAFRSAARFVVAGGDFRLTSVMLPISFEGPDSGTLRVRLVEEVGGLPDGPTLEVLSQNETIWPLISSPFTATTTLTSDMNPLLSDGGSYWIITELTSHPLTYAHYRWFHNLSGVNLRTLYESSDFGMLPTGSWAGASDTVEPMALRVDGVWVP